MSGPTRFWYIWNYLVSDSSVLVNPIKFMFKGTAVLLVFCLTEASLWNSQLKLPKSEIQTEFRGFLGTDTRFDYYIDTIVVQLYNGLLLSNAVCFNERADIDFGLQGIT